jgi:hypothetical protein
MCGCVHGFFSRGTWNLKVVQKYSLLALWVGPPQTFRVTSGAHVPLEKFILGAAVIVPRVES